MGNRDRNRDNFDLGNFDDFDEPSFTSSSLTDDIDLTPSDVVTTQGGRNTRFIVLASVLVLLILLGAIGIILLAIDQSRKQEQFQGTAVAVFATNTRVAQLRFLTETAAAWTDTPTYTPTPTDTPTPTETPTPTPTNTPDFTQTADAIATQNAAATQTEAILQLSRVPIEMTQTAQAGAILTLDALVAAQTQTAIAILSSTPTPPPATLQPGQPSLTPTTAPPVITVVAPTSQPQPAGTQGPIEVIITTPIFDPRTPIIIKLTTDTPVPTLNNTERAQTQIAQGTTTPTLPDTGFFDDVVLANAGPMGMTMLTISALGLVTLIVAARRLRVQV